MAATLDTALSVFSGNSIPRQCPQFFLTHKPIVSVKLHLSITAPISSVSQRFPRSTIWGVPSNGSRNSSNLCFELCFSVQQMDMETAPEQTTQEAQIKKKLFVFNLPWSLSVVDIKNLFAETGTVKDVEIIKQKDGKSRGFAFVTMVSGEEAQAVVDKFDSYEISGRIIRVEFAKRFRKPAPTPAPPLPPASETRHKLYVSNLAWKARSTHLKEFFSEGFNPISSRVVFESPSGRSAGYGFVSFATKEEAEAALSALDGKELMGRAIILKMSEKNVSESETGKEEEKEEEKVAAGEAENS